MVLAGAGYFDERFWGRKVAYPAYFDALVATGGMPGGDGPTALGGSIATDGPVATGGNDAAASIDSGANVFVRPADGTGTVFLSSWSDPNGSDYDEYVYDDFTPAADDNISQVLWRGAYINNQLNTAAVFIV